MEIAGIYPPGKLTVAKREVTYLLKRLESL
jgi:hypothetical protein